MVKEPPRDTELRIEKSLIDTYRSNIPAQQLPSAQRTRHVLLARAKRIQLPLRLGVAW
jgi:hypothetical protein